MPAYPLFPYEKIAKAYKVFGSTRRVAKLLGCSNFTVHRAIKLLGVPSSPQGIPPGARWEGVPPGVVAQWVKAHADVVMPLAPKKIEQLVGCTRIEAYNYLKWRRKHFKEKVKRIPDLRPLLGEELTITGDVKALRLFIKLHVSKKTLSLYEEELDTLLVRLSLSPSPPKES